MVANVGFNNSFNIFPIQRKGIEKEDLNNIFKNLFDSENETQFKCTDGKDDGKISVLEAGKCIIKGLVNNIKESFSKVRDLVKKHPFLSMLTVCAAVACMTTNPFFGTSALLLKTLVSGVSIFAGAKGLIQNGKNIFKAAKIAKNTNSDIVAKKAFTEIGNSSGEICKDSLLLYGGIKEFNPVKAFNVIKNGGLKTLRIGNNKLPQLGQLDNPEYMIDYTQDVLEDVGSAYNHYQKHNPFSKLSKEESAMFFLLGNKTSDITTKK